MHKKLLVSVLIGISLLFSLGRNFAALAAEPSAGTGNTNTTTSTNTSSTTWYNQDFFNWYGKVYDEKTSPANEIFGERYTAAQVQWILFSLGSTFLNIIPGNPALTLCLAQGSASSCFDVLPDVVKTLVIPNYTGMSGGQGLASVYMHTVDKSPMSGIGYIKSLSEKISPVSTVKAADQGIGYTFAGNSVVGLWRIARNISFSFLVIAIVVIAFMIMFRVKINPQTVISIQSALPKLILTLILITFSYAIAGFAIDLMYVVIGIFATFVSKGAGGLSQLDAPTLFANLIGQYNGFDVLYTYWVHFVASAFRAIFGSGSSFWMGILVFIFAIFTIIAMLVWSVKIIIMLVKNFALLMITIVAGPLEIAFGAITNKFGFGSWLRQIVSYIAVYPILTIMVFFSFFFLNQGMGTTTSSLTGGSMPFGVTPNIIGANYWSPPFSIATSHDSGNTQLIWVLVSFFIFSQITKVAEIIQSLFSGKPFDYGSAIGEATGAMKSAWGSTGAPYLKTAQEVYSRARLSNWSNELINKFNNKKDNKTKT